MPAKSKAFQRLAGAAEHGATFPKAEKLRESMTHQQLHEFASGSEKGKPEHAHQAPKRALHPALAARARAVKDAHAHLKRTVPGFHKLPGHEQIRHTQAHVRKTHKPKPGGY